MAPYSYEALNSLVGKAIHRYGTNCKIKGNIYRAMSHVKMAYLLK